MLVCGCFWGYSMGFRCFFPKDISDFLSCFLFLLHSFSKALKILLCVIWLFVKGCFGDFSRGFGRLLLELVVIFLLLLVF